MECLENDRTDGTSSQCFDKPGYPNQYLKCVSNECQPGLCDDNSNCGVGYCCTDDPNLPLGIADTGNGKCVSVSSLKQPYLCTS